MFPQEVGTPDVKFLLPTSVPGTTYHTEQIFPKGDVNRFFKTMAGDRDQSPKDILCKRSCPGGTSEDVSPLTSCLLGEEELRYSM